MHIVLALVVTVLVPAQGQPPAPVPPRDPVAVRFPRWRMGLDLHDRRADGTKQTHAANGTAENWRTGASSRTRGSSSTTRANRAVRGSTRSASTTASWASGSTGQ